MSLDVWLHDVLIATLHRERGLVRLRWSAAARARWGDNARVLSQSLPTTERPARIEASHAFFTELLPEGTMRARMAATAAVAEPDTYALLEAYGQDCVGAVVVLPSGSAPPSQQHGTLVAATTPRSAGASPAGAWTA